MHEQAASPLPEMRKLPERCSIASKERGVDRFPADQCWEQAHIGQGELLSAEPGPVLRKMVIDDFQGLEQSGFRFFKRALIAGKATAIDPIVDIRLEQVMPALNRVMALDGTEIWGVIPARPLIQHLHQRCAVVAQDPGLISLDRVNQDRDRGSMGRRCTAELIDTLLQAAGSDARPRLLNGVWRQPPRPSKAERRKAEEKARHQAQMATLSKAATMLQKIWRGKQGRTAAEKGKAGKGKGKKKKVSRTHAHGRRVSGLHFLLASKRPLTV